MTREPPSAAEDDEFSRFRCVRFVRALEIHECLIRLLDNQFVQIKGSSSRKTAQRSTKHTFIDDAEMTRKMYRRTSETDEHQPKVISGNILKTGRRKTVYY
jgi:hypothetical protein